MSYVELSGADLALAALLLVVNGGNLARLPPGAGRSFAIAAVRMAVQLAAVGFVLNVRIRADLAAVDRCSSRS